MELNGYLIVIFKTKTKVKSICKTEGKKCLKSHNISISTSYLHFHIKKTLMWGIFQIKLIFNKRSIVISIHVDTFASHCECLMDHSQRTVSPASLTRRFLLSKVSNNFVAGLNILCGALAPFSLCCTCPSETLKVCSGSVLKWLP